jgi:hypothetical protein
MIGSDWCSSLSSNFRIYVAPRPIRGMFVVVPSNPAIFRALKRSSKWGTVAGHDYDDAVRVGLRRRNRMYDFCPCTRFSREEIQFLRRLLSR